MFEIALWSSIGTIMQLRLTNTRFKSMFDEYFWEEYLKRNYQQYYSFISPDLDAKESESTPPNYEKCAISIVHGKVPVAVIYSDGKEVMWISPNDIHTVAESAETPPVMFVDGEKRFIGMHVPPLTGRFARFRNIFTTMVKNIFATAQMPFEAQRYDEQMDSGYSFAIADHRDIRYMLFPWFQDGAEAADNAIMNEFKEFVSKYDIAILDLSNPMEVVTILTCVTTIYHWRKTGFDIRFIK
ncbi:MAG: hypothetical protein ACYCOU_03535 [Sulfobacillus sp.]